MAQYRLLNKTALEQILQSEHIPINQIMRKPEENLFLTSSKNRGSPVESGVFT